MQKKQKKQLKSERESPNRISLFPTFSFLYESARIRFQPILSLSIRKVDAAQTRVRDDEGG